MNDTMISVRFRLHRYARKCKLTKDDPNIIYIESTHRRSAMIGEVVQSLREAPQQCKKDSARFVDSMKRRRDYDRLD